MRPVIWGVSSRSLGRLLESLGGRFPQMGKWGRPDFLSASLVFLLFFFRFAWISFSFFCFIFSYELCLYILFHLSTDRG